MDFIVESYAGPHDFLNHPMMYAPNGMGRSLSGVSKALTGFQNGVNVALATPVALASMIPDSQRFVLADKHRRKERN